MNGFRRITGTKNAWKKNIATADMGLEEPTIMILYKWINNQVLESIDGHLHRKKTVETDRLFPNLAEERR